jgi:ATP-dependent Clp protease, protease subunit
MADSTLRVPYNLPGSSQWQWVNIYTRLSQERILFLNQPITHRLANSLVAAMLYLDSDDQTKPICLYINSLGDPVAAGMADLAMGNMSMSAGMAIYDTMQSIKSEIVTVCLGQATGMAALLLSSGSKGKRTSLPHSTIALNYALSGMQGQATDIQINAKEVISQKSLVLDILAKNTGQSADKIRKDSDRMLYLTPDEAQSYGLIDRVLSSTREALTAA